MAADSSLEDEIKALIEPWRHHKDEPPFSDEELIAICLSQQHAPMTLREIMRWLTCNFDHFREIAFDHLFCHVTCAEHEFKEQDTENFVRGFERTFDEFDLPVTTIKDEDEEDDVDAFSYEMSPSSARITLQRLLATKRRGTFPFLRLPAEIRATVYEMVLAYPRTGLTVSTPRALNPAGANFRAVTREYSSRFSFETWDATEDTLRLPPASEILSLLLVNKQIFQESVACFYRVNTFYFHRYTGALEALQRLAPLRRQHLNHLAFDYDAGAARHGGEVFKILASIPNLRKLDIRLDEARWYATRKRSGGKFFIASTIAGLDQLTDLGRDINVEFSGNCPTVSTYWKPKIEHQTQAATQEFKKRKAKGGGRKQPTRATKVKKTSDVSKSSAYEDDE